MATANDVIKGALRLIGAIAAGEEPDAHEAQSGLDALNQMLHGLELDGINLGHADLALAATVNLPASHVEALRYLLACGLAAEYERTPQPFVLAKAAEARRLLAAHYGNVPAMHVDSGLLRMPGQKGGLRQ